MNSLYSYYREVVKRKGIDFPVTLQQITKIDSVNIFQLETETKKTLYSVVPVRVTRHKINKRHVNLFHHKCQNIKLRSTYVKMTLIIFIRIYNMKKQCILR